MDWLNLLSHPEVPKFRKYWGKGLGISVSRLHTYKIDLHKFLGFRVRVRGLEFGVEGLELRV